jgi:hypothetical protein
MIPACDCVDSSCADVKRLTFLIDDTVAGKFDVRFVVADKGYDAEYTHREIRERIKAEALIPLRKMSEPAETNSSRRRTSRFNRGRMKFFFDRLVYGRRSRIETVNSMVKRKMGDIVYGRSEGSRYKEILFRCVAHNIRGLIETKYSL